MVGSKGEPDLRAAILPNVGVRPCSSGTFGNAHLAGARHALLLCSGYVESFNVDVYSVNRYVYAEDPYCRISYSGRVLAVARLPLPAKPPHALHERPRRQPIGQGAARQQTFKQRCRCACPRAPLAACAPYPPPSGALIAPPTAQVRSNRPLQLLPLLRTAQPQQSHGPGRNAKHPPLPTYVSSSLPVHAALCTHAPMRTAAPPTALRGRLPPLPLLRWLRLHRSSPSTSAAQSSLVRPLSACHCTRPSHAHAHAHPAFDPATAAVRRCQIG